MEIIVTAALIGYIIYLRYYADLRSKAEQDVEKLHDGIQLYDNQNFTEAKTFFWQYLQQEPKSSVAYLYLARSYRALGDVAAATEALKTGESYDDSVAELHLEIGQILYDQSDYNGAFLEFDKAVFHAKGLLADAYLWRGKVRQQLGQLTESQLDTERAIALTQQEKTASAGTFTVQRSFFDQKFIRHVVLIFVNSVILLIVLKNTTVIHLPYLFAAVSAASIGFLEPKKGWLLALLQTSTLWVGYTFFTTTPQASGPRELEMFGLYGSIILTFVGSFIGGLLKRQLAR